MTLDAVMIRFSVEGKLVILPLLCKQHPACMLIPQPCSLQQRDPHTMIGFLL
jgi:hypothetical protein